MGFIFVAALDSLSKQVGVLLSNLGNNAFQVERRPFGTTLARSVATKDLRSLNHLMWIGEKSYRFLRKGYKEIAETVEMNSEYGSYSDADEWQKGVDEFRTRVRQSTLISSASLLEVYLRSSATYALYASPELIDRSLKDTNSALYIKYTNRIPHDLEGYITETVKGFTEGSWNQRFSKIRRVFGSIPATLLEAAGKLQSLQDRRNSIAHRFGYTAELRRTPWATWKYLNVDPSELQDITRLIHQVIKDLDNDVFAPHIGSYELMYEYHRWLIRRSDVDILRRDRQLAPRFRGHIQTVFSYSLGLDYVRGMIKYYDDLQ